MNLYFLMYKKYVHPNQKIHDLYATKHISEMVLPDVFGAV